MRIRCVEFGSRRFGMNLGGIYGEEYKRCAGIHFGFRTIFIDYKRRAK